MFKKIMVLFILFFAISSTDASALSQYFRDAKKAEETGNYERALNLYKKVLEQHPHERKAVLRAYDHMLNIYKTRKDKVNTKNLLGHLKSRYPDSFFDLRDIEKLSLIYLRHGEENEALRLKWKIINEPYSSVYRKTILRTYSRLLEHYKDKKDLQMHDLLNRLKFLPANDFDERDIYKYAMLNLKYGDRAEAVKTMRNLVQTHPDTVASRKALFVLAEDAQKARDYDTAMEYYAIYIETYPENTFFVQKAYQRIVDCYLAVGDKKLSEKLMKEVADWVNGISDYRSQLNLAIDLKSKKMDKLAEVTFKTGYSEATGIINKDPASYDALKAYLEIQRAAYAIGRSDIVEHAAVTTLGDFNNLNGNAEFNKNVAFVKSQAYLWLAKIHSDRQQYDDTITMLEELLRLYPEHKDRDYALYELGKTYENKGLKGKAREFYSMVTSEPLKGMARQRLAEIR